MDRMVVWLMPNKKDEKHLVKIVNKLANDYNASSFIPHLTLYLEPSITFVKLKQLLDEIFKNQKSFKINKLKIGNSEEFFKPVYIEIEMNNTLAKLFEKINSATDNRSISDYKPHISLLYKKLSKKDGLKIVNSVIINSEFKLDRVLIVSPKLGDENFDDIKSWRFIYSKKLDN